MLDNVLEAIILIDDKGKIEYTNSQASSIFQYAESEMINKNVKILMPENYSQNHDGYISNYLKTTKAKVIGIGREVSGMKKNGEIFPLDLAVNEVKLNDNRTKFVGVLKDITEKKKSDFYLESVANIQKLYISGADQNKLFDKILKFLLDYRNSKYGFIGAILYDENNTPYLKTYAITNIAWNEETKAFYTENAPKGLEFKNLDNLFGHTIKTGEVVISNDPASDHRSGGLPKGHPDMNCYLGMPVNGSRGLIAMYGLANKVDGYNEEIVRELSPITTVMSSIIEASRGAAVVEKMANIDALTGAYNRFYLKSRLADILKQKQKCKGARLAQEQLCIMMIDLNKFKHINDYYGHEYGDNVLKEFVGRLKNRIQQHDLLARIGGDEFVVVLDGIPNASTAGRVAQRIVQLSREPYIFNDKEIICSASVGIACYPVSGNDTDTLLRHADLALYKAKPSQDGYSYFSEKLQHEYTDRQNLERDILRAFAEKEFYLVYQPIVDLSSYNIMGCEVLIRWMHPEYGEYLPVNYIETIEAMGLAGELNLYVVSECLRVFKQIDNIDRDFSVSINISPHAYSLEENLKAVIALFEQEQLNPNLCFNLEITEKSFMEDGFDVSKTSNIHKLLAKQNIGLSLYDFGVEYSSITRLLESDFSIIKIDMSFVQKLDVESKEMAQAAKVTIESIIHLAKGLGIQVVAEGVETEVQSAILSNLGCRFGQGYYFSKPTQLEQLLELISSKLQ